MVYKTTLCLLSKCLKCLLAWTPLGPRGHQVEVSHCLRVIVHVKGLYVPSSLTTMSMLLKLTQKLSWDWSGLKEVSERGGITAKFMTQILILVQEGWSRAVKKTLERYSVSMSVCVCVGWGLCELSPHPAGSSASSPSFRNNQQTALLFSKPCLMSPSL